MKNKNKLQNSQTQLEITKQEITKSVVLACDRCNNSDINLKTTVRDLTDNFSKILYDKEIIEAIRFGAMGKYGVNYKLTTQIIGSWIHRYIKDKQ